MTTDEFFKVQIGMLLYNQEQMILVKAVSELASHITDETKKKLIEIDCGIWTRHAYTPSGYSKEGAGDIKISDCSKWHIVTSLYEIHADVRGTILHWEISNMKFFLSSQFSAFNNQDFKGIL